MELREAVLMGVSSLASEMTNGDRSNLGLFQGDILSLHLNVLEGT
jgi:hypothetical protein